MLVSWMVFYIISSNFSLGNRRSVMFFFSWLGAFSQATRCLVDPLFLASRFYRFLHVSKHMPLATREKSKIVKLLQCKLRETKRSRTTPIHPGRLTAGTYTSTHFLKENDLPKLHEDMFQPLIFRGVNPIGSFSGGDFFNTSLNRSES